MMRLQLRESVPNMYEFQNAALLQMGNYANMNVVFHDWRCLPSVVKLYILLLYHLRSRWCAENALLTYSLLEQWTVLAFISKFYSVGLYIKFQ